MFEFLKSGINQMKLKLFDSDYDFLRQNMSIEDQLKVYRLMRDDYQKIMAIAESGSFNQNQDVKQMAVKAMQSRNTASAQWKDKRNPNWMAAALIENFCNAILSGDMKLFYHVYVRIGGWVSALEQLDQEGR